MPRSLELVKIVAHGVFLERDESGRVVGEHRTGEASLFTPEQVGGYYEQMRAEADRTNGLLASHANGSGAVEPPAEVPETAAE